MSFLYARLLQREPLGCDSVLPAREDEPVKAPDGTPTKGRPDPDRTPTGSPLAPTALSVLCPHGSSCEDCGVELERHLSILTPACDAVEPPEASRIAVIAVIVGLHWFAAARDGHR